jgi:hypothetical protein
MEMFELQAMHSCVQKECFTHSSDKLAVVHHSCKAMKKMCETRELRSQQWQLAG